MSKDTVVAVKRALDILIVLGQGEPQQSISQLSGELSLPKSTIHRLLTTMEESRFIKQDPRTRSYGLGSRILELGGVMLKQLDLRTFAAPYLEELANATRQTISLAILDDADVIYLESFSRGALFQIETQVGKRRPAYCRALGKAIIAHLPEKEQGEIIDRIDFAPTTPKTICNPELFRVHLKEIQREGYAIDDEEAAQGCKCIAAPIFDFSGKVVAAVSVSGPAQDFSPQRSSEFTQLVLETSKKITQAMGGSVADSL